MKLNIIVVITMWLPFFACKRFLYSDSAQQDINRYSYCDAFNVPAYKGNYGSHPKKWIDKSFFMRNIINTKSLIEHDVKIGNHCHIGPSVKIGGGSSIDVESLLTVEPHTALAQIFSAHSASVSYGGFANAGRNVLTASEDGTVRVWDTRNGNCIHLLTGHSDPQILAFAQTPDAKTIITAGEDSDSLVFEI